jgi:predicted RecA/RadA family phage recombinase
MKNQVSPGHAVDVLAPYNVASGAGCLIGSLFGVAAYAATSGNTVTLWTVGVFNNMAKTSAQAWALGQLIYWDDANKVATTVSTGNKLIGATTAAAANPSSVGSVRLNGIFTS